MKILCKNELPNTGKYKSLTNIRGSAFITNFDYA